MPRKQPKRPKKKTDDRTTQQRMKAMIKAYAETGNLVHAARKAGISREVHYQWLKKAPRYAEVFKETKRSAVDYLKSVAVERAAVGWLEPVHYQGSVCGHVRRFDGGLLQFLLRGMCPEEFGNRTEVSGPQGKPIEAKIEVVFVKPKPE